MAFGKARDRIKIPFDYEDFFKELEKKRFAKRKIDNFGELGPFFRYQKKTGAFDIFFDKTNKNLLLERKKRIKVKNQHIMYW